MEATLTFLETKVFTPQRVKRKQHLRALFQGVCFALLVVAALTFQAAVRLHKTVFEGGVSSPTPTTEEQPQISHSSRLLETSCDEIDKADPGWLAAFMSIGVLYMFLALAIVCDEFFVPALEEMSSKRQLNLSMDVAGATLMAAGGSAPELFSSLFGTFTESEIGFGTIIGSAVFNVLFVIAMCSLFSKEVLSLTWWPLFRDSSCYAVGLVVLALFVGVSSKEEIELWEAVVLFCMYLLYIALMWKNADLYKALTGEELVNPEEEDDEDDTDTPKDEEDTQQGIDSDNNGSKFDAEYDMERPSMPAKQGSASSMVSMTSLTVLNTAANQGAPVHMRWQGTFRAGILKLLRDPGAWVDVGGVGIVAKISGDADYVFKKIDKNGDGSIDKEELKKLFEALDAHMTDAELDEVFNQLDSDGDGKIGQLEFNAWYTNSQELIRAQVHQVFDKLDTNRSGTLDKQEIRALLVELDPNITDQDVNDAVEAMYQEGSTEEITFEEFSDWYQKSILYERQKKAVEEDMEGVWESLKPPHGGGCFAWAQYIVVLPLVLVMAFTIPDVRRPGWGKWCYVAFILSIAWIGAFSYLMVTWTEIIGNTIGIPSVIMGLTVLAAGTSVPDLLSSVIVARRGSGDMAVSSSIGSNIFDILVGLPIPWILYTAWPSKPDTVEIGSDNIWIFIFVLLGMLVFVIVAIHCQGWKLTKTLAVLMLVFYAAFLALAIVLELPFETCTDN